jgi:hypothetical protein
MLPATLQPDHQGICMNNSLPVSVFNGVTQSKFMISHALVYTLTAQLQLHQYLGASEVDFLVLLEEPELKKSCQGRSQVDKSITEGLLLLTRII